MATSGSFPAGRVLGRYRVSRRLGSGGFARVYRALDPDLEIDIALKVLRPELAADPDTVERFRREASTAAKLRHPNVITVLSVGRLDEAFDGAAPGTPYLVMDYLAESLADRLASGDSVPSDEVARVGAEVARGLGFAHRHGIVHRDVKPENVLFARDGRAVVTDFGIARAVAGSPTASSRQVVLGTPTFFSPEQARGLPLDGRSDIYALGVTLFRAATGTLPFGGDDWYEVMRHHVETAPPRARAIDPSISAGLDAAIARCLAKRPEDRFANAEELAIALEGARGLRTNGSATMVVPGPVRIRNRRRPAIVAATAVAAVTGVVVAANAVRLARTPDREPAPPANVVGPRLGIASSSDSAAAGGTVVPGAVPGVPGLASAPEVLATAADAAARRAAGDSQRAAAPSRLAALAVTASAGAEIYFDGVRVARGAWQQDRVPTGRHVVRATVAALPGCASADTSVLVELAPGGRRAVRLDPVACGLLDFDVVPAAARFTLTSERGDIREGVLPIAQPLFLPEGDYALTIDATQCASYNNPSIPVVAGRTRTERARLLCE